MKIIISLLFVAICSILFSQTDKKPKLFVGIVVDQMCFDYISRFETKFSKNGFLKLKNKGTYCHNTQYNYIPTYTGPGHASIYTGTTPSNHGIVANDWYDRTSKKEKYCVSDTTYASVGTTNKQGQASPKNLKVNTITDQLKLTYAASKVISISIKDRSAVLPGGHLSDGSYWFDQQTGNFITSTFYKNSLPNWVNDFNNEKRVQNYMTQTWNTYYPIENYTESEADNSPYEKLLGNKKTPEFPYNLAEMNAGKKDVKLFTYTPFANTILADFAKQAIKHEGLGTDEIPDVLALSFSAPDIIGHTFGPYSKEIEDTYIRLDLDLANLITHLEETIGKDNFVLFLTADHAVVPVPQYLKDKKLPAGYFNEGKMKTELIAKLNAKFNFNPILEITNDNIYLDRTLIAANTIEKSTIENYIAEQLLNYAEIKKVYTSNELKMNQKDPWLEKAINGYRYQLNGDLIYMLESGFLGTTSKEDKHQGTTHGSAYNYDTHVPLIFYGKNIPSQSIYREIQIVDIAATLAPILSIQRPNSCTGRIIEELFK